MKGVTAKDLVCQGVVLLFLLLLAGDVEVNPGPRGRLLVSDDEDSLVSSSAQ